MRALGKIALLVVMLLVIYLSAYIIDSTRYKSTEIYRCANEREIMITRSSWPILSNYDSTNGLEVYIGGWLDTGNVTISSEVFDHFAEEKFSANSGLVEVSRARLGDWYTDAFTVKIKPDSNANCAVRIIYKFRGI